jgi:hypothetical protein
MDPLEKLRLLLEGKTILKVEKPNAPEAICKFVLSDGTAFRLHATDLGFWIEGSVHDDGVYNNLTDLLVDYSNHTRFIEHEKNREIEDHFNYDVPEGAYYESPPANIFINIDADQNYQCLFIAPDGKEFRGNIYSFSEYEKKLFLFSKGKGKEILSEAAILGNAWTLLFSKNNEDCPAELCYIPGNE